MHLQSVRQSNGEGTLVSQHDSCCSLMVLVRALFSDIEAFKNLG